MKRWLCEPLVHFLVLGAVLFGAFEAMGRWGGKGGSIQSGGNSGRPAGRQIEVTAVRLAVLRRNFELDNRRPPTEAELDRAIENDIREEILVREARAQGLDLDDTIVRRRLVQKMEFAAEPPPPTDEQLREWVAGHAEEYRTGQLVTFEQLFIDREKRGVAAPEDARGALAKLQSGEKTEGDAGLPGEMAGATRAEVARLFGETMAKQVIKLPVGEWAGPVDSARGLHVVKVTARTLGEVPPLEKIRVEAVRDWAAAHRKEAVDAMVQQFRATYEVVINGEKQRETTIKKGGGP